MKLQAESQSKFRENMSNAMFKEDLEEKETDLISTQRRIDPLQEVFLRNHAVGGESSDEEEREAVLDEDCKWHLFLLLHLVNT